MQFVIVEKWIELVGAHERNAFPHLGMDYFRNLFHLAFVHSMSEKSHGMEPIFPSQP